MSYVDGFVIAILPGKLEAYKTLARKAGELWMEHGALSFVESLAEDVPHGEVTSFPRAVHLQDGETVAFSWITYESRAHRDAVMAKIEADPRMKAFMQDMPFDGKRMIFGGFETFLSL